MASGAVFLARRMTCRDFCPRRRFGGGGIDARLGQRDGVQVGGLHRSCRQLRNVSAAIIAVLAVALAARASFSGPGSVALSVQRGGWLRPGHHARTDRTRRAPPPGLVHHLDHFTREQHARLADGRLQAVRYLRAGRTGWCSSAPPARSSRRDTSIACSSHS